MIKKYLEFSQEIKDVVDAVICDNGGVYTDDLSDYTGFDRRVVTDWLKANGFTKPAGRTSKRWENKQYKKGVK